MARGPGKGNTNNPNGRPKGSPNKATAEIRERLLNAIQTEMKDVGITLQQLKKDNPAQYLSLLEKFMAYIVPKKRDITSDDKPITGITIVEDRTERETDGGD